MKMSLDCSIVQHVRVPHEQFVAIENKAQYLCLEDKDKGGCIAFTRNKEMSDEESKEVFDDKRLNNFGGTEKLVRVFNKVMGEWIDYNVNNLSEDEKNMLFRLVEKANKPQNKVWKPNFNEDYYTINGYAVMLQNFTNDNSDKTRYALGNCFKTEKEAKFVVEKLKVIAELKRFAEENNEYEIDWNNSVQKKWCIFYDHQDYRIDSGCGKSCQQDALVWFTSSEIAERAIKTIGEDRLRKYYFEAEN